MKVKINDPWEEFIKMDIHDPNHGMYEHSTMAMTDPWNEVEVTVEELKDLIDKGYKIKINC
jgi:hypothetical protein